MVIVAISKKTGEETRRLCPAKGLHLKNSKQVSTPSFGFCDPVQT